MIRAISGRFLRRGAQPAAAMSVKKLLYDTLYWEDTNSVGSKILNSSNFNRLEAVNHQQVAPKQLKYQATKLSNGLTVFTESTAVPGNVQLGILINTGTRDQTPETSGSLLSIKNTLFKTVLNTNQTVNYGVHQMSGGEFSMDYDREMTYWKASCLAHDVVDLFGVLVDCAFEPRSVVAASVGQYKNTDTHKLDAQLGGNQQFIDNVHKAAYGTKGLGMPLYGLKANIPYLTAETIQKFQVSALTPDRVVICAAGVDNHQEFVDLVDYKLSSLRLPGEGSDKPRAIREQSKYHGGEIRSLNDSKLLHSVVMFDGADLKNNLPLLLAQTILGESRNKGRIHKNILAKNVHFDNAESFKYSFSDAGLFGLKLSGSAAHGKEVIETAIQEIRSVANITEQELNHAKHLLLVKMFRQIEEPSLRLENAAKLYSTFGSTEVDLLKMTQQVTVSQVEDAVRKALKSQPVFVFRGENVNTLGSYDLLASRFN